MRSPLSSRRLSLDQWIYLLAIVLLSMGGLGGSLQPSRLLSICLLPFVLSNLRARFLSRSKALDNATVTLAASLVALAALSIGWSLAPAKSAGFTVVLCINMLPLLYLASLSDERRAQLVPVTSTAWALCMAITLPLAFYELTTGEHFIYALDERGAGEFGALIPYASVFFGNFNDYSLFLTLCITALVALSAGGGARRWRFALVAVVLLGLGVLIFNSSRGALGATLLVLLIRLAVTFGVWRILAFAAVAALAAVLLFDLEDSPVLILVAFKFTDVTDDLTNDDGRLAIISACLHALAESYGLGLGADAYIEYLAQRFPSIIPNPHNLILELALNFTLLGLVIFAGHAVTLLRRFVAMFSSGVIPGAAFALRIAPLLLLPLIGVVQSHLTGYTYFWYWYSGFILLSTVQRPTTKAGRGA